MDSTSSDTSLKAAMPQVLATMAKNLILLGYGMTLGFPTIVIPSLQNAPANATLSLTDEEVSWFIVSVSHGKNAALLVLSSGFFILYSVFLNGLQCKPDLAVEFLGIEQFGQKVTPCNYLIGRYTSGSINLITVPLGCVVSGVVTQPFGRKRSMQVLTIPFLITWIMFYFADSVGMLYASLALTGLAGGLLEAPILTYVAEITQPHIRGILSASSSLAVILGMFTQFLMGNFWDWRTLSAINAIAPFLAFVALCFIPESPHWLIGKNRLKEAQKALSWLRGWVQVQDVQKEFEILVRAIKPELQFNADGQLKSINVNDKETAMKDGKNSSGDHEGCCTLQLENYKKRTFTVAFALVCFCFFSGHFSGMTTLTTFAVNIFATLGAPIDKYLATMILGIAQLLGTLICVILIHYTGKRPLVFVSTIGSAFFFSCVGFYAYFFLGVTKLDNGAYIKEHLQDISGFTWVPMTCLIGGSFFAFLALRLLPWILIGEVYPTEVRAFASGASASVGYILGFASNKTFFKLMEGLTLPGVYWFYGGMGFLAFIVFYTCLPETEGWGLHEIEEHFAKERNLIKAGKKKVPKNEAVGIDNPCVVGDQVSKL